MLQVSDVRSQFVRLSGISESDALAWSHMIVKSIRDVEGMVDSANLTDDADARLCHAAAALSYYRYVVHSLTKESVSAFNVGDVKFAQSISDMLEVAREIKDDALSSIEDMRSDNPFAIRSV